MQKLPWNKKGQINVKWFAFRFPYILFKFHDINVGLNYKNIHSKLKINSEAAGHMSSIKKSVLKVSLSNLSQSPQKNTK